MAEKFLKKILVLTGPTATGKSRIAIQLAKKLDGEIISADSRQVYKLMDIGTAKPTKEEREEVVHHLIDLVFPDQTYSAGLFARDAKNLIEQILNRGKLPIIVGGTGLYLKSLTQGIFQGPGGDAEVRERLNREVEVNGLQRLYKRLEKLDPATAARISVKDRVRIVRALEVHELTGKPISLWQQQDNYEPKAYRFVSFGATMDRNVLYHRINCRVDKMMQDGFLGEVENLIKLGYSFELPALRTFGYIDMLNYLQGKVGLQTAVEKLKQKTRNFAKRQLTWFRHQIALTWVQANLENSVDTILEGFECA